jgi:D-amino peptidase
MKILIADDMEGITGVVSWNHVDPKHAEYARFRKLMVADVNAAVRGALAGGADEVVVSDGHSSATNIPIEDLDPRARLNTGSPSYLSMVQGVDQGVDGLLLVGYHARAGMLNAILCHTWTDEITNVWLNGRETGEIGLNGSLAGWFGVPVLMISGCRAACAEAAGWFEAIEQAVVKTASGRYAAECLPPAVTSPLIEAAAQRAVSALKAGQGTKPARVEAPVTIRLEFHHAGQADQAALVPGCVRVDGRTVEITAADMVTAYRAFRAAASLGH